MPDLEYTLAVSVTERISGALESDNLYDYSHAEISPLQMAAAEEIFSRMRPQIPVLDRRAKDGGVDRIDSIADIVPLLLSHTSYKTYPQSFVIGRQWDRLARWLGVVSTETFEDVDVADAADIDDFLDRMWAAGYKITTSSGTGGKVSLLPKNDRDLNYFREYLRRTRGVWPNFIKADQSRHFFQFGPIRGPSTGAFSPGFLMEDYGRPDSRHVLIEEPLLISKVSRMAEMREKMKVGTATPDEIREMESEGARQAARSAAKFDEMVEQIIALRHEPMFIQAMAAQAFELMERLRARGVPDDDFHPDTMVNAAGGIKHFKLPADWKEQIRRFFGHVHHSASYAMTEMNWGCAGCSAGHYHVPPSIIPLVLDEAGETLAEPVDGIATGRMALLDLTTQIRWGGTISGDKVTVDLVGNCECGLRSPNVHSVGRYIDLKGEDKIQCAGTIDAYIRGAVAE